MHILVVDDDQTTLQLLVRKIKEWGYSVVSARNGADAWDKLKSARFDLIVSDWMMPETDGLQLCRRIRTAEFKQYIYFILVSAQDTKQDIVHCLEEGVDDYIVKPVDWAELQARIKIGQRIVRLERNFRNRYDTIKKNNYQEIRASIDSVSDRK